MRRQSLALFITALLASVSASAADIATIARTCNNCHGYNGVSAGGSMPSIAGQPEAYLKNVMLEWKTGKRASANMTRLISGYTDAEIEGLAKYFAQLPWTPVAQKLDPNLVERGKQASQRCAGCHGKTGGDPGDESTPKLNGQLAKYLEWELIKYQDDAFPMPSMMRMLVKPIQPEDLAAIAAYYASQK